MGTETAVLTEIRDLEAALPEWRAFARQRAGDYLFFQDPDVFVADLKLSPDRSPLVVFVRTDGELACVAPCYVASSTFRISFSVVSLASVPVRLARVAGSSFVFAKEQKAVPLARAALLALSEAADRFDLLSFAELREPSAIVEAFVLEGLRLGKLSLERASSKTEVVHRTLLPDTHAEYIKALGGGQRSNLKRAVKGWRGSGTNQAPDLDEIRTPERISRFLEHVEVIFPKTWQAKTFGVYPRNTVAMRTFLTGIAERGWMRGFVLHSEGKPVAFILGYQQNGTFYYEETGYDPAFSSKHPGIALNCFMIERLFEADRPKTIDFGFGDNTYKRALANDQLPAMRVFAAASTPFRALIRAQRGTEGLYQRIRPYAEGTTIERLLRDLLKRRGTKG